MENIQGTPNVRWSTDIKVSHMTRYNYVVNGERNLWEERCREQRHKRNEKMVIPLIQNILKKNKQTEKDNKKIIMKAFNHHVFRRKY